MSNTARLAQTGATVALPTAIIAQAYAQALRQAEAFAGATAPNPPVGCVALSATGEMLACEAHQRAGAAHAEVATIEACRRAGVLDQIHTLVVTLEPCNHTGRTPPCTEAILATSAKAVWIGAPDPNRGVLGGGAGQLASAGVVVNYIDSVADYGGGDLGAAAERLIAPFATWSRTGRPWVTLKQALTPEGGMMPPSGCKTFTSAESLTLAHGLRRRADAIITGSGCVLADNPSFTVRRVDDHPDKRRRLAILDRRGRVPAAYVDAARARGFDVMIRSDLEGLLDELGDAGVLEALVETGPTLLDAVLEVGLWDEHITIRQSPTPGRPDAVETRLRAPL